MATEVEGQKLRVPSFNIPWQGAKLGPLLIILIFASFLWAIDAPEGIDLKTWHLFIIFVSTIAGIILKPLPMGSIAILALAVLIVSNTLTLKQSLITFSNTTVWLVVFAFFFAKGFVKTGLGNRIAYYFIGTMGKSSLGLSYGIVFTEFLLSPVIPSNTARGAGVIFPIIKSLAEGYGSDPKEKSERKIGAFLMKVAFHANVITSAMFLTALAGNPLIAKLAGQSGASLTWASWAIAAIVPGLVSLILLPLLFYILYPPILKKTPLATKMAKDKLKEMGKLTFQEGIMLLTFSLVLVLWVMGDHLGIDAAEAAVLGLSILLLTGVLNWNDLSTEKEAWTTLVWFAVLLMMAGYLTEFGMISWVSNHMSQTVSGLNWGMALLVMGLVYYYSHYLFASVTAHISSMYSAFLLVVIAMGTPPMLGALTFAVLSSLSASVTHYGTGTAPVFYGSGYVDIKDWWRLGFIVSIFSLLIWGTIGLGWWKLLGYW